MKSIDQKGILGILESQYRSMTHEQLVQTVMSMWKKNFEERLIRKQAGAKGKAEKNIPAKVLAAEVYIKLRSRGSNVSAKQLYDALKNHKYPPNYPPKRPAKHQAKPPKNDWEEETIRDWIKVYKAALSEVPKENWGLLVSILDE